MLSQDVERYVDLQRSLGFKFGDQSCSLRLFARMPCLTATSSSVGTCPGLAAVQTASAQRRCTLVARFAASRSPCTPKTSGMKSAASLRGPRKRVGDRLIYTAMKSPGSCTLPVRCRRRALSPCDTYNSTGAVGIHRLRISEALSLECSDAAMMVSSSAIKHGKSRLVPLHETSQAALNRYLSERARWPVLPRPCSYPATGSRSCIHSPRNIPAVDGACRSEESTGSGPRIHDLRHTFAVRSLEQCRPDRLSVALHMLH